MRAAGLHRYGSKIGWKTCDWELGCGKGIKNAAIGLSGRLFRIDGHVSIDKGLYGQNVKSHTFWFAQYTLCKVLTNRHGKLT